MAIIIYYQTKIEKAIVYLVWYAPHFVYTINMFSAIQWNVLLNQATGMILCHM
jgi:hypothetical protein